ncbi:MAG: hypothetical protein WCK90_03555 [archaeon]
MPAQFYNNIEGNPHGLRNAFGFVGKDATEMQRKYLAGLLETIEY